jgi:hypothetical protein
VDEVEFNVWKINIDHVVARAKPEAISK